MTDYDISLTPPLGRGVTPAFKHIQRFHPYCMECILLHLWFVSHGCLDIASLTSQSHLSPPPPSPYSLLLPPSFLPPLHPPSLPPSLSLPFPPSLPPSLPPIQFLFEHRLQVILNLCQDEAPSESKHTHTHPCKYCLEKILFSSKGVSYMKRGRMVVCTH